MCLSHVDVSLYRVNSSVSKDMFVHAWEWTLTSGSNLLLSLEDNLLSMQYNRSGEGDSRFILLVKIMVLYLLNI
jgi:hypothetical protein